MKNLVLTPGPVPVPRFVMLEMAKPIIHHRTEEFEEIFYTTTEGLKRIFQTKEEVLILASSGTGAMEAAVSNTLSKGDKALVINGGKFGERWLKICKAFGVEAIEISVEWGHAVDPIEVEKSLSENKDIKAILIQASETSTGVKHPIKEIAAMTRERDDVILIVDGISAVAVFPIEFDNWGIDILIGGSQKAFMLPPGLAFLVLSKKAWEFSKKSNLPKFYFDLEAALKNNLKKTSPWTPAITLVIGLNAVLNYFNDIGLDELYRKHSIMSEATREGFRSIGLKPFAFNNPSTALSAIMSPNNIDAGTIVKKLREQYGIIVAGGQDQAKGKIFRITHMGDVNKGDILVVIDAVENILEDIGFEFEKGLAVRTATEIFK